MCAMRADEVVYWTCATFSRTPENTRYLGALDRVIMRRQSANHPFEHWFVMMFACSPALAEAMRRSREAGDDTLDDSDEPYEYVRP